MIIARFLHSLAGLALFFSAASQAHQASDAYLTLREEGSVVEQRLDVALRDLDRALVLDSDDDGQLQWREVRQRWGEIEALAEAGVQLQAGGQACQLAQRGTPQLQVHGEETFAVLQWQWQCPAGAAPLKMVYRLFDTLDASHRGLLRITSGPGTAQAVLSASAEPQALPQPGSATAPNGFASFVAEGVHHILIGADHVLFLFALLLPAVLVRAPQGWASAPAWRPVLRQVLWVVSSFTLAHSITLSLAVLDLWRPPSRIVEVIIAGSVLLAAVANLRRHPGRAWGLAMPFGFGLVHGFGFANALERVGLQAGALAAPLLGFNLGVELGQLALVALFVPLAWALRGTAFYRQGLLRWGSGAIAVLAGVWMVERALDLQLLKLPGSA